MRAFLTLVAITLSGGVAAAWFLRDGEPAPAGASIVAPSVVRRQSIAFYEHRLTEDPHSALDMAQLAAVLMEDGRMTGDERAFVKAESLARRSLGERTRRNGRSAALLVNALLAQHRFGEAAEVARELVASDPETPAYRALLAEALMEVGDYNEAIQLLGSVRSRRADLGIAPRFARWAELTGQPGEARRILLAAREEASRRPDLDGEQRAWFSLRLADLELRHGRLRGASSAIKAGLRESPGDWRLLLASVRLSVARRDYQAAIRAAEEVIATVPSADAFALLATAHAALGHDAESKSYATALEGVVRSQPSASHRAWGLALIDVGLDAGEVVALAAQDTLVRHDAYSLDLLAWALHSAGRSAEAVGLARRALSLGSVEPILRYHAGMIEASSGDRATAERHLTLALRGRGALTPAQVDSAKHALDVVLRGEN